jgi:hypothetical protein
MSSDLFLRSLVDLAACESIDSLLESVMTLLEEHLDIRGYIEVWSSAGERFSAGALFLANPAHCTWIGIHYTVGAIRLQAPPAEPEYLELLACQVAPLAERLVEHEAAQRRTIRAEIDHVYERRIQQALIRSDWNATTVARELGVGRTRVIEVIRRLRARSRSVSGQDT